METLLTRITSVFNISKTLAITPAGLISALALALLLWPPHPIDTYMKPSEAQPNQKTLRFGATPSGAGESAAADPLTQLANRSCTFTVAHLKPVQQAGGAGSPSDDLLQRTRKLEISNQAELDDAAAQIVRCIAYDNNLLHQDDAGIAGIKAQIVATTKERDTLQAQYLKYATDLNGLSQTMRTQTEDSQKRLDALVTAQGSKEQRQRQLQANIDLENVYLAQVKTLLSNPDPLRTRQDFDTVLVGFGNHILTFIALAMLIGYVLDPGNAAIFGFFFDNGGMKLWNRLRPARAKVVRAKDASNKFQCGDYTGNNEPRYLLYPSYAIGQNLITQAQLDALKSQFYAQSQLAFGLIIPTILLLLVLLFGVDSILFSAGLLILVTALLCLGAFLIGMDRLHRYYSELQLLIRSAYCVKVDAKVKADAADRAATDSAARIKAAADAAAAKSAVTLDTLSKQVTDLKSFVENWVKAPVSVNINTVSLPEGKS